MVLFPGVGVFVIGEGAHFLENLGFDTRPVAFGDIVSFLESVRQPRLGVAKSHLQCQPPLLELGAAGAFV